MRLLEIWIPFDGDKMNHLLLVRVQVSVTGYAAKDVAVKFAFLGGKGNVYVQLDVLLNWELVRSSCFTGNCYTREPSDFLSRENKLLEGVIMSLIDLNKHINVKTAHNNIP